MQSKTSFFNLAIFKINLKRTAIVGLMYFLYLILAMPVSFVQNLKYALEGTDLTAEQILYRKNYQFASAISETDFSFIMMMMAIIGLMIVFKYLYVRRDNYMMHAFPVSRTALFVSGILALVVSLTIPTVLISLVMLLMGAINGVTHLSLIGCWAFSAVASMIFFTGFGILCMMLSGQLVAGLSFYLILNFVWFAMEMVLSLVEGVLGFGLGSLSSNIDFNVMTPSAYMSQHCRVTLEANYDEDFIKLLGYKAHINGMGQLVGYLIVGLVFAGLALFIYNKKKLETVNDFIPLKTVQIIFTAGMSFFVSAFLGDAMSELVNELTVASYDKGVTVLIISAAIIGIIIFFAIQMLIDRSVRVFTKKKVRMCAVYTVCAVVFLLTIRFDVYGVENKIPDTDDVEWAGISGNYTFVFDDAEEIDKVRAIHSLIIDDKKEIREMSYNTDENSASFIIKYRLKNGKTITRDYILADETTGSEQYASTVSSLEDFLNDPTRIKEHIIGDFYNDCEVKETFFSRIVWNEEDQYYESFYDEQHKSDEELKKINQEIYAALLKDIDAGKLYLSGPGMNTSDDELLYNDFSINIVPKSGNYRSDEDIFYNWSDDDYYGYTQYTNYMYVTLSKDCTNTLKALKENGYYTEDSELVTYGDVNAAYENDGELY